MSESEHHTKDNWHAKYFTDRIIKAVNGYDIPLSELPGSIDLSGKLTVVFDQLIAETMADPRKRERVRYFKLGLDKNSLILSTTEVGSETSVSSRIDLAITGAFLGPQHARQEYFAFSVHTHGVADMPPSPKDVMQLLSTTEKGGGVAEVVITPSIRFLLVRTIQTPDLEAIEIKQVLETWNNELRTKGKRDLESFSKHMSQFGGAQPHQLLLREAKLQMDQLTRYCKKYDIAIYTSSKDGRYTLLK